VQPVVGRCRSLLSHGRGMGLVQGEIKVGYYWRWIRRGLQPETCAYVKNRNFRTDEETDWAQRLHAQKGTKQVPSEPLPSLALTRLR